MFKSMLKVKAVIFDMDGLMINTEHIGNMICVKSNKKFGYEITEKMLFDLIGRNSQSARLYFNKVFGKDYPYDEIKKENVRLKKEYYKTHDLEVKPGLYQLLDYLKNNEIKMAVASSTISELVIKNLKEIHADHYFDCIIGGDQIVNGKPDPEIFLKALKLLGVKNDEAVVLEDSKNGILASYNANIPVICIPDIVKHTNDILEKTYMVIDRLDHVIDYIGKL